MRGGVIARVTITEQVGDPWRIAGNRPELPRGRTTDDGRRLDTAGGDLFVEDFETTTRSKGMLLVANVPRAHRDMCGLETQRFEPPAAGVTAFAGRRLSPPTIGAQDDARFLVHAILLSRHIDRPTPRA